jgi:hypothetical protein
MKLPEERTTYTINFTQFDEIRRLIRLSAPHLRNSHCAEAIARGLLFETNAALLSSLESEGKISCKPDRIAFEDLLSEKRYAVRKLQASLFPEAVRLAVGGGWRPVATDDSNFRDKRVCMSCADKFYASGFANRICGACKIRDGRTLGFNHRGKIHREIRHHAFLHGHYPEKWEYLSGRPGWPDFLRSETLTTEIEEIIGHRERIKQGDFTNIPDTVKEIFQFYSFVDIMGELEVPRKKAQLWFKRAVNALGEMNYEI